MLLKFCVLGPQDKSVRAARCRLNGLSRVWRLRCPRLLNACAQSAIVASQRYRMSFSAHVADMSFEPVPSRLRTTLLLSSARHANASRSGFAALSKRRSRRLLCS